MTPDDARAQLAVPVEFVRRSLYWSCSLCAAMVWDGDQEQHRRAHALVAAMLDGGHDR